jgi:tetratricopeptide (TPR) repeat protein
MHNRFYGGMVMRAACWIMLWCCAVSATAHAAAQEVSRPLYVKFGGQVRDENRVLAAASSRGQPLKVLEEKAESVRVQLKDGAGWISRIEIGTREEVLKDASQRIANEPDNVELRLYRLNLLSHASPSDRIQALADLEHVIQLAPHDPRGYFLRGSLRAKTKQFDAAIDDFSQCLKLDPKLAPAHLERGMAFYALREFDIALEDLNAYVKLEPNSAEGLAARGMAHVEMQKNAEAEADFAQAIKLDNQLALPWFERARMWMRRHNAAAAVTDLSETLKRDPQHLDATIFLATLLACGPDHSPRDGKRAVELATVACRLAGDSDFRPVEALAAAYAEAGDFAKAIEQQEKALAMLTKAKAAEGAKNAARYRLSHYKANQPVRLMR